MKKLFFKTLTRSILGLFLLLFLSITSFAACNIDLVGAIGGACQNDGTVLYRIIVNYQDAPGSLDVNGTIYPVTPGSSAVQQNLYLWLPGDGATVDVIAKFVDNPNCKDIAYDLFTTSCCIPNNTACNDGNNLTINDRYTDCVCEGTCGVIGNNCNDGKANTYNDTYNANCDCVGIPCPANGTACNDGNPATYNDRENGFCDCIGTPCPSAGTACNDGNPATYNDFQDGFCNCVGVACPSAGTACNDGNAATSNDIEDGFCNCAGTIPCLPTGTACNDGNPATYNDIEDGFCNCVGVACPSAGTACNDGNLATSNDVEDGFCNCAGTIPCLPAGTACNDGNSNTINDVEDGNCNCTGTIIAIQNNFTVAVKVFLEGYMNGSSMRKELDDNNLLPANQPYSSSSILSYNGTEVLNNNIDDIVDWVLVALMDANGNIIAEKAAMLTKNGLVRSNGTTNPPLIFNGVDETKKYRVAVFHRSHLAVVSNLVKHNGFVDFTVAGTAQGNIQTLNISGNEVIYAGDLNQDGIINNLDFNIWDQNNSAVYQYLNQDIDGNGITNNLDFNLWDKNKSKVGNTYIQL